MRFNKDLEIERAMVIYAHPDDAEFSVAGTVAKWAKAGVEVTYCMVTNGASGSQDPDMTREKLRDMRYAEQREAGKVLGVKNVVFLGTRTATSTRRSRFARMSRARSASTGPM